MMFFDFQYLWIVFLAKVLLIFDVPPSSKDNWIGTCCQKNIGMGVHYHMPWIKLSGELCVQNSVHEAHSAQIFALYSVTYRLIATVRGKTCSQRGQILVNLVSWKKQVFVGCLCFYYWNQQIDLFLEWLQTQPSSLQGKRSEIVLFQFFKKNETFWPQSHPYRHHWAQFLFAFLFSTVSSSDQIWILSYLDFKQDFIWQGKF